MEEEETPSEVVPTPIVPTSVKLTPEGVAAAIDHINRKAVSPNDACPVCGSPNNTVLEEIYQLSVASTIPMVGGQHQPLISTVCNSCGFVRFFNRIIVDWLIEAEKEAVASPAPNEQVKNGG